MQAFLFVLHQAYLCRRHGQLLLTQATVLLDSQDEFHIRCICQGFTAIHKAITTTAAKSYVYVGGHSSSQADEGYVRNSSSKPLTPGLTFANLQGVDEEKEARKKELARLLLAGGLSLTEDDAKVFEGLSPSEIQAYVAESTDVRCSVGVSFDIPSSLLKMCRLNFKISDHILMWNACGCRTLGLKWCMNE